MPLESNEWRPCEVFSPSWLRALTAAPSSSTAYRQTSPMALQTNERPFSRIPRNHVKRREEETTSHVSEPAFDLDKDGDYEEDGGWFEEDRSD